MALFDTLSNQEARLFTALMKVPDTTLWGLAINRVVEEPTVKKYRELIKQLKSQAKDNPKLMATIIGADTLNLLNTIN